MPGEAARAARYLDSLDPASGEVIGRFEATTPGEVPLVIEHARRAQQDWARRPVGERAARLEHLAKVLYARRREVAEVVTRENGKPLAEALLADVLVSLDSIRWHARRAPRLLAPERISHHNPAFKSKKSWVEFEPCGVIAVISPWNYPFAIPLTAVVPAVAAGNAVVVKPSELAPWCGALLGELFDQADFPIDLVQVIQGPGELGAALIDAGPDKVLFTGSVGTGRRVAEACARRLIPSVLELGGKDAMIVLADADVEAASSAAVWGSLTNCGQACLSVERIYVEPGVAGRFTELCVEKTRRLRLGSGLDPNVDVGPMIRKAQIDRVEKQLKDAVARGARVLTGGRRRPDVGPQFFEPAVVTGVGPSMLLMQEETFGPVVAIAAVADAQEAVRLANDSPFALGASVWTGDRGRGESLARQLRSGSVMVNDVMSCYGITEAPHGGSGASGWGRTHSKFGLLEMVQVRYVDIERFSRWAKPWWFRYDQGLIELAEGVQEALFGSGPGARWRGFRKAWREYRARRRQSANQPRDDRQ
ncbi:MAG TPA: aldehyde dehydrogenase family protein [Candidatus Acidoferrales bacterium]|nr:aldehyde dehydrogenase family protein [Candidatus Acidoferrales bacterium]